MTAFRRKIYNNYLRLPPELRGVASKMFGLLPTRYKFGPLFISTWDFIKKTEFLAKPEIKSLSELKLKISFCTPLGRLSSTIL
jgi:hypothetical protein